MPILKVSRESFYVKNLTRRKVVFVLWFTVKHFT